MCLILYEKCLEVLSFPETKISHIRKKKIWSQRRVLVEVRSSDPPVEYKELCSCHLTWFGSASLNLEGWKRGNWCHVWFCQLWQQVTGDRGGQRDLPDSGITKGVLCISEKTDFHLSVHIVTKLFSFDLYLKKSIQ